MSNGLGDNTIFDLDLRSRTRLPSTLYIMGPMMHQQSLKWLSPIVLDMHLQENTLFDLDFEKCSQVSSTSCDLCTCTVYSCYVMPNSFDLDLRVKNTGNVAQYPLHHVTYTPAKFKGATSSRRKYII